MGRKGNRIPIDQTGLSEAAGDFQHEYASPAEPSVGELLRQARGAITLVDAAEKLGVSKNTLMDYELSKRMPGLDFLREFATKFDVDASHLAQALLTLVFPGNADVRLKAAHDDNEQLVPFYDVSFSAGNGHSQTEERLLEYVPVPKRLLREWGVPLDRAAFVKNLGDSMYPTLGDGDPVLLDRSIDTVTVSDMIYAFRLNDELRIKRIRKLPGGGFELRSDNARYSPEKLPGPNLYDFRVLGGVKTVWRKLP